MPSRSEGFPLAVVEAMLAALPVVATRVGSVEEAVIDGETGLLVKGDRRYLRRASLDRRPSKHVGRVKRMDSLHWATG